MLPLCPFCGADACVCATKRTKRQVCPTLAPRTYCDLITTRGRMITCGKHQGGRFGGIGRGPHSVFSRHGCGTGPGAGGCGPGPGIGGSGGGPGCGGGPGGGGGGPGGGGIGPGAGGGPGGGGGGGAQNQAPGTPTASQPRCTATYSGLHRPNKSRAASAVATRAPG